MEAKAELLGNMKQVRVSKTRSLAVSDWGIFWTSGDHSRAKLIHFCLGEQSRTFSDSETGVIMHQANEMASELLLPPFNWNYC